MISLHIIFKPFLFFCFFSFIFVSSVEASQKLKIKEIEKDIDNLLSNGIVGLYRIDQKPIYENLKSNVILPASIQKILLSQLAIEYLGLNYQFQTNFYQDQEHRLIIQGLGDPFLVSEEIQYIAEKLIELGYQNFSALVVDDSLFEDVKLPGVYNSSRPHDSLNGALIVNFNTILIVKDKQGKVLSGEEQTPLTPLAKKIGTGFKKNTKKRVNLGNDYQKNILYTHQLFQKIFEAKGIRFKDKNFYQTKVKNTEKPFYTHRNTRKLDLILRGLLEYSNNYIANQIMLVIGAKNYGYPTNLKKGLDTMNQLIQQYYQVGKEEIYLVEASGISRENRISLRAMKKVLELFKPYAFLMNSEGGAIFKSGTLRGVYNYAGYFQTEQGLRSFIIHTISKENHRDRILKLLGEMNREIPFIL